MNWNEESGRTLLKALTANVFRRSVWQIISGIAFSITNRLIDAKYSLHELGLIDAAADAVGEKFAKGIREELKFIRDVQDSDGRISPKTIVSEDTNETINV